MSDTQPTDLLVYYAANAPEAPDWFKTSTDHLQKPAMPPLPETLGDREEEKRIVTHGFSVGRYPGKLDEAKQYEQAHKAWVAQCQQVDRDRQEHVYFAWRWYYAEKMKASKPASKGLRISAEAVRQAGGG